MFLQIGPREQARAVLGNGDGEDAMISLSKGKGIGRAALKRLKFESYKRTLFGGESMRIKVPGIQSFNFKPYKVTSDKLALQVFEGKFLLTRAL